MNLKHLLIAVIVMASTTISAQELEVDSRLRPHLKEFFQLCKSYNINYYDKLFKLKSIDIVNTLEVSEEGSTLGMLRRDEEGNVEAIDISWLAQLDVEILKVVAYHEFAHYFLEYETHLCDDCGKIMAVQNTSYYDIVRDWDNQIKMLFEESPAYQKQKATTLAIADTENP